MIMPAPWRRWADPAPMSGLVISRCAITELTVDLGHCGCGGPETRAPAVPLTPRADSVFGRVCPLRIPPQTGLPRQMSGFFFVHLRLIDLLHVRHDAADECDLCGSFGLPHRLMGGGLADGPRGVVGGQVRSGRGD